MKQGLCGILVGGQLLGGWLAVGQTNTHPAAKREPAPIQVSTRPSVAPSASRTSPVIAVSPRGLDFASVKVGRTRQRAFTVQNVGGGILTGAATVSAPFSIVGASRYALGSSQSQVITVQYEPQATGMNMTVVLLTGAGGASLTVAGSAVPAPRGAPAPPQNLRLLAGP